MPDAVILVTAPAGFIDVNRLEAESEAIAADKANKGGRHLVIADPNGDHRLWIKEGDGSAPLAVLIPMDSNFQMRVEGALRFARFVRGEVSGPNPRRLDLTPLQRTRLIQMLRAADARSEGASYREIASVLVNPDVVRIPAQDWKSSALHSRIFRLVKDAAALIDGGYRKLLSGDWP